MSQASYTLTRIAAQTLAHYEVNAEAYWQGTRGHDVSLKPGGVLFSSNPRGEGQEGWNGDRYGAFHDWPTWQRYMTSTGFIELAHYYRPAGLPLAQQPWLASVWRKPEAA